MLNIWTKPQTGEKKKAVMVSIYGGGKKPLAIVIR
jgi:carboxylesterase type B